MNKLAVPCNTYYNINMTDKNWRDLFVGISLIVMSTVLWFNEQYTLEISILIGVMTMVWLLDK
tara:strand:- start:416 stop:604 length:189 start_codon:yes stop_codon:yes gene_type:complete